MLNQSDILKQSGNVYSAKAIKILAFLEFIFYSYLVFRRVDVISGILRIDKRVRQLIDLYDYENGWNFIFLLLLLMSNILTFSAKRLAWTLKQTGLICISITLIWKMPWFSILSIMLFVYYSTNKAIVLFGILLKEKTRFYLKVILFAGILLACSLFLAILKY